MACRINHSRIWATRLMLEAQGHVAPFFVTFTYKEEPDGRNLRKEHLCAAVHRLRTNVARLRGEFIRYYAAGEYGDQFGRPHYHLALFGLRPEDKEPDPSRPSRFTSKLLQDVWSIPHPDGGGVGGTVDVGDLTPESAEYITGYITKKLIAPKEVQRPDGRNREFAVMSRNPGIGLSAALDLIETLNTSHGALYIARHKDVPAAIQVGTRLMPIGPHIRRLLRRHFFGEENQPKEAKQLNNQRFYENIQAHLPPLRIDSTNAERIAAWIEATAEARDAYHASLRQKKLKLEKRHQMKKSKEII